MYESSHPALRFLLPANMLAEVTARPDQTRSFMEGSRAVESIASRLSAPDMKPAGSANPSPMPQRMPEFLADKANPSSKKIRYEFGPARRERPQINESNESNSLANPTLSGDGAKRVTNSKYSLRAVKRKRYDDMDDDDDDKKRGVGNSRRTKRSTVKLEKHEDDGLGLGPEAKKVRRKRTSRPRIGPATTSRVNMEEVDEKQGHK